MMRYVLPLTRRVCCDVKEIFDKHFRPGYKFYFQAPLLGQSFLCNLMHLILYVNDWIDVIEFSNQRLEAGSKNKKEFEELQAQLKCLIGEEQFPMLTDRCGFWMHEMSNFKVLDKAYTTVGFCQKEAKISRIKTRRQRKQHQIKINLLMKKEQGLKAAIPAVILPSMQKKKNRALMKVSNTFS